MGRIKHRPPAEDEIEEAADSIMDEINDHELMNPSVTMRSTSIAFLETIIERCQESRSALREELEAEGEGGEEGAVSDEEL